MQHQLIAALTLLGAMQAASLPTNPHPIKDDFSSKPAESIATEDDSSSSTLPTATIAPVNVTQSNHTWPSMEDPNLFEGDMKVSKETIEKYYGKLKEDNSTKVSV